MFRDWPMEQFQGGEMVFFAPQAGTANALYKACLWV